MRRFETDSDTYGVEVELKGCAKCMAFWLLTSPCTERLTKIYEHVSRRPPPEYPINTRYMQCGCAADNDPFQNVDPKAKKVAGLIFLVNYLLQQPYESIKAWQDRYKDEWAIDEYVHVVTKKLMEMSEDEFAKYQAEFNEKVRQTDQKCNKSSDTDCQKGSGEGNEANLGKDSKSDYRNG